MQTTLLLAILELVIKYGAPAVRTVIETWNKDTVTLEDVEALKSALKHPDEY